MCSADQRPLSFFTLAVNVPLGTLPLDLERRALGNICDYRRNTTAKNKKYF